jgi:hypothetical protein
MNSERKIIGYGIFAFLVLSIAMSAGLQELRLKTWQSPWLQERDSVLKRMDEVDRLRTWYQDRDKVMESLESIETRIERLESVSHPEPEKRVTYRGGNTQCQFADYAALSSRPRMRLSVAGNYSMQRDVTRTHTENRFASPAAVGKLPPCC